MTRRAEDRESDKRQEDRVQARDDRGASDPGVAENLRNVHRGERQARGSVVQRLARLERKKNAEQIQSHHFFPCLDEPSFADGSQPERGTTRPIAQRLQMQHAVNRTLSLCRAARRTARRPLDAVSRRRVRAAVVSAVEGDWLWRNTRLGPGAG